MYWAERFVAGRGRSGRGRGTINDRRKETNSIIDNNTDDFDFDFDLSGSVARGNGSGDINKGSNFSSFAANRGSSKTGGSDQSIDEDGIIKPDIRVLEMVQRSNNRSTTHDAAVVAGILSGEGGKEGGANNLMPGLY